MRSILFATAMVMMAGAASAEPVIVTSDAPPPPSIHISYADLDLGNSAGRNSLEARIRGAARRVCGEYAKTDLDTYLLRQSCFRGAVADGLQQMNSVVAARNSGAAVAVSTLVISRK